MTLHYQAMSHLEPIYTENNCTPAYQLNWSYSVFWKEYPGADEWLSALSEAVRGDGIRILKHTLRNLNASQFLVSTKPETAPIQIAARIKGRLQYLVQNRLPKAFRRNYSLESVGSTKREKLEFYLRRQLEHHDECDARLLDLQLRHSDVDLSKWRYGAHARFRYNLHVCFECQGAELNETMLVKSREMLDRIARQKGLLVGRVAILPNHFHLMVGCQLQQSPQTIALAYLNNLAYSCGMRPLFKFGYFVGTFTEYDLGAIPSVSAQSMPESGGGHHEDGASSAESCCHRGEPGGEA